MRAARSSSGRPSIGHSRIEGAFPDELDPNRGNMMKGAMPPCGFACGAIETQMEVDS